ncbi:helix-turn-helix domain-containing protein [Castellaniella denitrificans]
MSQETLAFEANLDRTFISMLERGQRLPSIATVLALSGPLGLTGADLVGHVEAALASSRDSHPVRPSASR